MQPALNCLLVPVDLSGDSERAVEPALRLAARVDASVCLFSWSSDKGEAATAERHLIDLAASLSGPVSVEVAVTDDRGPAPAIAAAAIRANATIFMATHGRSGRGRARPLGSVAEDTLHLVNRPIVLVGPLVEDRPIERNTEIVACVDGSPMSEQILPVACAWAKSLTLPVQLIHVAEPRSPCARTGTPPYLINDGYLAGLAAQIDGDLEPTFHVLHGDPADAIADFAGTRAELIAVATHTRSDLPPIVLGSVAMSLVAQARRPVLVVRRPATPEH